MGWLHRVDLPRVGPSGVRLAHAGLAAVASLSALIAPATARAAGLTRWVEGLVASTNPGTGAAERERLGSRARLDAASESSSVVPEHDLEAQWERASDLGRRNGERFDQRTKATLSSDYGNGFSSLMEGAFETNRGPGKGEDDDAFEARARLYYDVLNPGAASRVSLDQARRRLDTLENRIELRARLEEERRRVASAAVEYVEKACLRRSLERAAARTRSIVAQAAALRGARVAPQKDLLGVEAVNLEMEARLEKAVAEQYELEPYVTGEGPSFARRLADAPFTDEAFCLPGEEFDAGAFPGSAGRGGNSSGASPSTGEAPALATRVDAAFELEAARAEARRESSLVALERWRADRRPSLKPFAGLGWEQEGGKDPRKVWLLGVTLEVRFGGYDEARSLDLSWGASEHEARISRGRAVARGAGIEGLWRRRVRAFEASARRHRTLDALRANLEAQWRVGLVETRDWSKALVDTLDAYEDLMGDWRDAALLRFEFAAPGGPGGNMEAGTSHGSSGPGTDRNTNAGASAYSGGQPVPKPPLSPPRPGQPGYPKAVPRR